MPELNDLMNTLEGAKLLMEALTNQPQQLTRDLDQVLRALQGGRSSIVVEIPWGEKREGEVHDRHQILLMRLEGPRVFFINALKNPDPVGSIIRGRGPDRRVEPKGEESMALDAFRALFTQQGQAML